MNDRKQSLVRRLCQDGLMLALLCVIGMLAIPIGENIKVSLQLLVVFLVCFLSPGVLDCLLITGCYLLMGLFMPIYAGFVSGVTPTFGFVIGFVVASPVLYFLNRIKWRPIPRMIFASLVGLLIVYAVGTGFMMGYLQWDLGKTLLVSLVPYLPFDAVKIGVAVFLSLRLRPILGLPEPSETPKPKDL